MNTDSSAVKVTTIRPANDPGRQDALDSIDMLARTFQNTARRAELIIYPVIALFTVIAIGGFLLIYSVTKDLRGVVSQVEPQMGVHLTRLTLSLQQLTDNISQMSSNIKVMQENVANMAVNINVMAKQMTHLESMDRQMTAMNHSMELMSANTSMMRYDMANMNRSISRPMNFASSFMPFMPW